MLSVQVIINELGTGFSETNYLSRRGICEGGWPWDLDDPCAPVHFLSLLGNCSRPNFRDIDRPSVFYST